jgi:WD40 repeat protein
MSFSGAGDPVLTASDDNTAKLWSIEKVNDIQTLPVRTVSAHLQNGKE